MTDHCKSCHLRGDINACKAAECHQHENWYAVDQQKEIDDLWIIIEDACEMMNCHKNDAAYALLSLKLDAPHGRRSNERKGV